MRFAHVAAAVCRWNFYPQSFQQRSTTSASKFAKYCEKLAPGFTFIFFHLVWLVSSPSLHGQDTTTDIPNSQVADDSGSVWKKLGLPEPNPNAPYANPPKLELLFDDDFATDSRNNYEISGKEGAVTWEPGKLTLGEGGRLSRQLDGDNWVELELDIQFPELTEDGQKSELKILLDLESATDSYLLLRQRRRDGKTTSEIVVYDTPESNPNGSLSLPKKVRSERMVDRLPSGTWKIQYNGGLWAVDAPGDSPRLHAYIKNGHSIVISTSISITGQSIGLRSIQSYAVPRRALEWTTHQARELKRAAMLNEKVFTLGRQGGAREALPLAEQALGIRLNLLGAFHSNVADSLNNLAYVRETLGTAEEAEPLHEQTLALRKSLFPGDHPSVASSIFALAWVRKFIGRAAEAEPLFEQALEMTRQLSSDDNPEVATCLDSLANVRLALGRAVEAEPLLEQALAMNQRLFPGDHSFVAGCLHNLANVRSTLSRAAEAEILYEQALAMNQRLFPGDNLDVARSLHNLALVRYTLGRTAEAEMLLEDALAMMQRLFPGDNLDVAANLISLAAVRTELGRAADAAPLVEQALAMQERLFPGDHPSVATSINNLAYIRQSLGRTAEALPLFEQSLAMKKRLYPGDHPSVADGCHNLAHIHDALGGTADAERLFDQALAMRKRLYPEDHPNVARGLHDLAHFQRTLGNLSRSDALHSDATEMAFRIIERDARFMTEEQQLTQSDNGRRYIDRYFDLTLAYPAAIPSLRALWWQWKGAVTLRQQQSRLVLRSSDVRTRELAHQLQDAARQLATLANSLPDDTTQHAAWREQLVTLSDERTRLERELAALSGEFRTVNEVLQTEPETILDRLPDDCLVVDLIQQRCGSPPQYLAMVSRRGAPPVLLSLGGVTEIDMLVEQARANHWVVSTAEEGAEPAPLRLRHLVWDRLSEHLTGIQTILISPDGLLATVPWGALPGNEPSSYLIEQYAIGILPAPQLLARMLHDADAKQTPAPAIRSLLLLGDIDFGAAPGTSTLQVATRSAPEGTGEGGNFRNWLELPNAGPEMSAVRGLFEDSFPGATVTRLRQGEATEDRFRIEALKHSVLHLVTHGYFAPEQMKSVFQSDNQDQFGLQGMGDRNMPRATGYPPGLLSGIVLAGANRRPEPGQDDGILTALEVMELDLRCVELVTLSACETGLGPVAGGEGLLGLQRSFQLAGAGTVVASLWKVPDAETQLLMQEFHRNLWDKKLGKLEALRQAQLKLLREQRTRGGTDELGGEQAGAAPRLWGAWVLSGDWR